MDETDLPAIMTTLGNKEKMDKISFVINCANKGLITFDEADEQINSIIRAVTLTKKWICDRCGYIHEGPNAPDACPICVSEE